MTEFTYHRSEDGSMIRRFKQHSDGSFTISSHQECEAIIEQNKRDRELQQAHGTKGEIFRKVASIPASVYDKAVEEGWAHDEDKWRAWLNDYDNRVFRVYEGQL